MTEERLNKIEERIENLSWRLRHLEQAVSGAPLEAEQAVRQRKQEERPEAAPRPEIRPTPPRPQRPARPQPETVPATPRRSVRAEAPSLKDTVRGLEELLGGRLLAWAGGAAFIVGVGFFFALAISNGWIGETMRVILGFAASASLLGGGVWLHQKKDRTQASLAMAGVGIAGLFLSLIAATKLYELIPSFTALVVALCIGAIGTVVAVRFSSQIVGGLGLIGALLAPALVGAEPSGVAVAFIMVALASTVGVLTWQRWWWLAFAAFLVSVPQLLPWVDVSESGIAVVFVLSLFLVLNILAAIGYELRVPSEKVRASSLTLLTAASAVVALAGYFRLDVLGTGSEADIWIVGLAVFHLALGLALIDSGRFNRLLGVWIIGKGVALADIAFGLIGSGPVLSAGWSVSAAFFAFVGFRSSQDRLVTRIGVLAQLALAAGYIVLYEAPFESVSAGPESLSGAIIGLATFAAALFICARLLAKESRDWMRGLDSVGFIALAYLAAVTLDDLWVVVAWVGLGVATAVLSRYLDRTVAMAVAGLYLAGALLHSVALEATPASLVEGLNDVPEALASLLAVTAGCFAVGYIMRNDETWWKPTLYVGGSTMLLYLASTLIITPFQPGGGAEGSNLINLDILQRGQVLLSVFWALTGLAFLAYGLLRDKDLLRLGGFGLLVVAIIKVFFYDLSTLDSMYRVLSLVVLGLLLLAAAYTYQRLRTHRVQMTDE